jgi:hypothetical protein
VIFRVGVKSSDPFFVRGELSGALSFVLGTLTFVLGTLSFVLGALYFVLGARCLVLCAWYFVLSNMYQIIRSQTHRKHEVQSTKPKAQNTND